MVDRLEVGRPRAAHLLGGRVRRPQAGVLLLEPFELAHEDVELGVGDRRRVAHVVREPVLADLLRQRRPALARPPPAPGARRRRRWATAASSSLVNGVFVTETILLYATDRTTLTRPALPVRRTLGERGRPLAGTRRAPRAAAAGDEPASPQVGVTTTPASRPTSRPRRRHGCQTASATACRPRRRPGRAEPRRPSSATPSSTATATDSQPLGAELRHVERQRAGAGAAQQRDGRAAARSSARPCAAAPALSAASEDLADAVHDQRLLDRAQPAEAAGGGQRAAEDGRQRRLVDLDDDLRAAAPAAAAPRRAARRPRRATPTRSRQAPGSTTARSRRGSQSDDGERPRAGDLHLQRALVAVGGLGEDVEVLPQPAPGRGRGRGPGGRRGASRTAGGRPAGRRAGRRRGR